MLVWHTLTDFWLTSIGLTNFRLAYFRLYGDSCGDLDRLTAGGWSLTSTCDTHRHRAIERVLAGGEKGVRLPSDDGLDPPAHLVM